MAPLVALEEETPTVPPESVRKSVISKPHGPKKLDRSPTDPKLADEADKPVPSKTAASILDEDKKFLIVISQWQTGGGAKSGTLTSRGTLQSTAFPKSQLPKLTLAGLRQKLCKVSEMSSTSRIHKFCTGSGVTVGEEHMSFRDYLDIEELKVMPNAALPTIPVTYKLSSALNQPKIDMATLPGAREKMVGQMRLTEQEVFFKDAKKAKPFTETKRESEVPDAMVSYKTVPTTTPLSAGMLTEAQWAEVLQNCGLMYGWVVDQDINQIVRAPKAAFQLRSKTEIPYANEVTGTIEATGQLEAAQQSAVPKGSGTGERGSSTLDITKSDLAERVSRLDIRTGGLKSTNADSKSTDNEQKSPSERAEKEDESQKSRGSPTANTAPKPPRRNATDSKSTSKAGVNDHKKESSPTGSTSSKKQVDDLSTRKDVNKASGKKEQTSDIKSIEQVDAVKKYDNVQLYGLTSNETVEHGPPDDAKGTASQIKSKQGDEKSQGAEDEKGQSDDKGANSSGNKEDKEDDDSDQEEFQPEEDDQEGDQQEDDIDETDDETRDVENDNHQPDEGKKTDDVQDEEQPGKEAQGNEDQGDEGEDGQNQGDGGNDGEDDEGEGGQNQGDGGNNGEDDEGEGGQNQGDGGNDSKDDEEDAEPPSSTLSAEAPARTVFPSFVVNDDSRIEITISSHEFETSMACNDFSKSSTEGSVAGGYSGFSLGINYGRSSATSDSTEVTTNTYQKTMIAKYLLPRADVLLHPDDLEPTPDLKEALSQIQMYKNIQDLRKLHQDFGHIFCRKATIGGRLLSTKIMTSTGNKKEQEQKEQFKTSFGAQLSTPVGAGAGVQHSKETGKSSGRNEQAIVKQESNVFEAVGGNTILASNPLAWAATVADPNNWRTITRDKLASMAEIVSMLPGFASIKNDFIQSVAKLTSYYEVGTSREVHVRFRVTAPTTQLSLSYLVKELGKYKKPNYYLGHAPSTSVTPRQLDIKYPHALWGDLAERTGVPPLFVPQSYRSPVIIGYSEVSDALLKGDRQFKDTVWKITAPFHDALQHGSRVAITNMPLKRQVKLADGTMSSAASPASSMVVFRNQQGVFLPGMSNNDEVQYWRILKKGGVYQGEHIREGDEIRLCWAFADQTTGFRDFTDDVFGRRRNHVPEELRSSVLYLKVPWPRFEPIEKPGDNGTPIPNSLILSTVADETETYVDIPTVLATELGGSGLASHVMQDVSFRIDPVANNGEGDGEDYLLDGINQKDVKAGLSAVAALSHSIMFM